MSVSDWAAGLPQLVEYRIGLRNRGWRPIPLSGKTPTKREWPAYAISPPTDFEIRAYGGAPNTGIVLTDDLLVVDIDELDSDHSAALEAIAVEILGPTPFRRVGKAPKVALLYRLSSPVRPRKLPSVDILTRGQQLAISGIHPETGLPYVWTSTHSPDNASPHAAPQVHPEQIERFIAAVGLNGAPANGFSRSVADQPLTLGPDGRVSDGRETLLRNLIHQVGCRLSEGGRPLTTDEIATEAWALFIDRADLSDEKWQFRDARTKAAALVRRVKAGTLALPTPISIAPAYPDTRQELQQAEQALTISIDQFFQTVVVPWVDQRAIDIHDQVHPPSSWAIRVETGLGKTSQAIAAAHRISETHPYIRILFAVPTHALADEVVARFRERGCDALAHRGYAKTDPHDPEYAMCRDLKAYNDARAAHVFSTERAICSDPDSGRFCGHHRSCGMTRQRRSRPLIWVIPHALLFTARPSSIPHPTVCIIDESFVLKAIPDESATLNLDEILFETHGLTPALVDARKRLHAAFSAIEVGPVTSAAVTDAGLSAETVTAARSEELALAQVVGIYPGMNEAARQALVCKAAPRNTIAWTMSGIWQEVHRMLSAEIQSSGRLQVIYDQQAGARVVSHSALSRIHPSWKAPNLFLDATLPDPALLEGVIGHPVHLKADISVRWPDHVRVRQILHAPVSSKKLGLVNRRSGSDHAIVSIREFVVARADGVADGEDVLVVAQKGCIDKLKSLGLPQNVRTAHFGALAGLDKFKDAAGLICIGRPQPRGDVIERMRDILTGEADQRAPQAGLAWFPRVVKGLRCAGGAIAATEHYAHLDPAAEALRWQTCEAELIQALGRIRPCRREAPAFIDLLTDVPLPILVHEVKRWHEVRLATPEARFLEEGVLLYSPDHLHLCFNGLWKSPEAARKWLTRRASGQTSIENVFYTKMSACFRYKMPGAGQKWREGRYDPRRITSARDWLETRAGPVAAFVSDDEAGF